MSKSSSASWQEQFGLDQRKTPEFFSSPDELTDHVPQSHLIRRGFNDLDLDGVFCTDNAPLIYFLTVDGFQHDAVRQLVNRFWHHGGAPVLVLVSDKEVQIYSGLMRPGLDIADNASSNLVKKLDRFNDDLLVFMTSVESGVFFYENKSYFDPAQRVDQALLTNLNATRNQLDDLGKRNIPANVLDALLCRLVFTCYLFDREVIDETDLAVLGIENASHLRDILNIEPKGQAKVALYRLFQKLAVDFNGDLFADDLDRESNYVVNKHIRALAAFFHGTDPETGQMSFWPYDFSLIPVETISAIYEQFLKDNDRNSGAFYTPRFLAEVVLDIALLDKDSIIGSKFLDPACGSGIFLVGLFNRLAEEWKQLNPEASNDEKAKELIQLLTSSLFGVDINETACRITAFSLYLAFLEQLSPRTIRELQKKGQALPRLIGGCSEAANLTCADFFDPDLNCGYDYSLVIGNPPWGDDAKPETLAGRWCAQENIEIADCQIASAFAIKSARHTNGGDVCLVLPHGLIFSRQDTATQFQKKWLETHTVKVVLNLTDYQNFLFEEAKHPAIVTYFSGGVPPKNHAIKFWSPKSNWAVLQAEVIPILPEDRTTIRLTELIENLESDDAPQLWKEQYWATARDRRLLKRLETYPRLRKYVAQLDEVKSDDARPHVPWIIAQGFQPMGPGDNPDIARTIHLPTRRFIEARSSKVDLFLLNDDCEVLGANEVEARRGRSEESLAVFLAPHVLIAGGFKSVAFADFDVSFRSSVRAIHGPEEHEHLLVFLTVYLKTELAKYYLFHTSSSWGVNRARVYDDELLGLPFCFPEDHDDPQLAMEIVEHVAAIVSTTKQKCEKSDLVDRKHLTDSAMRDAIPLIYKYFDVLPKERELIDDTVAITIPSTRPSRKNRRIHTLDTPQERHLLKYRTRVCEMLNHWSRRGPFGVRACVLSSFESGVAIAIFEKVEKSLVDVPLESTEKTLVETLSELHKLFSNERSAIDIVRGVKVFDGNLLYVVKPLFMRHWTLTAAMNDADEIAGSLLMEDRSKEEDVTIRQ